MHFSPRSAGCPDRVWQPAGPGKTLVVPEVDNEESKIPGRQLSATGPRLLPGKMGA